MSDKWLDEAPAHLHSDARADYLAARRELYELHGGDSEARRMVLAIETRASTRWFTSPDEILEFVRKWAERYHFSDKEHKALERMMLAHGGGRDTRGTSRHKARKRADDLEEFHKSQVRILIVICIISLGIAVLFFAAEYNVIGWIFLIFALAMGMYGIVRYIAIGSIQVLEASSEGRLPEPETEAADHRPVYVNTLQTPKGHVILTWSANRPDILKALDHSPEAASRPILAKLAEILNAHPDAELTKYQNALGIELREVERTWDIQQDPLVKLAESIVGQARSLVEIEALKVKFLREQGIEEGTDLYKDVVDVFDAAIQAIKVHERI